MFLGRMGNPGLLFRKLTKVVTHWNATLAVGSIPAGASAYKFQMDSLAATLRCTTRSSRSAREGKID